MKIYSEINAKWSHEEFELGTCSMPQNRGAIKFVLIELYTHEK